MSEDVDKVLDFFKDIIAQLGPAGEQAFSIVYQRVVAESIITIIIGLLLIILGGIGCTILHKKVSHLDDGDGAILTLFVVTAYVVVAGVMVVESSKAAINLLSPEYAAIERILNLVNGAQ